MKKDPRLEVHTSDLGFSFGMGGGSNSMIARKLGNTNRSYPLLSCLYLYEKEVNIWHKGIFETKPRAKNLEKCYK